MVQVTVLREYNVQLIWDNTEAFASATFLGDVSDDSLFTLLNTSGDELFLRNIQIADFDPSAWQRFLMPDQCAQIWTYQETQPFQREESATIQGGNVTSIVQPGQQFWA